MSTISASTTTTTAYKVTADTTGALVLQTGATPTTAVTIDTSQNVGVGGTSSSSGITIGKQYGGVNLTGGGGTYAQWGGGYGIFPLAGVGLGIASQYAMTFLVNNTSTQAMTLDNSGNLLVGSTSTVNPGGVTGTSSFKTSSSSKWAGAFENSASSSPWGVGVTYTGAAPNGTSNAFFYGTDTGGDRFFMRSNGGLANYSANNANLSDERTKTDIQNAGGYLAKICAIPVRTFKYKDQTDDLLNLGVIAQEVEAVAPELVDVSGFGETPEDGVPLKAIYQTDLQYALMKCIQELETRLAALENK